MLPTLVQGPPRPSDPTRIQQRGDVIVFRYPEDESKLFVKRIVGLPDLVELRDQSMYLNGVPFSRDAFSIPTTTFWRTTLRDNLHAATVPPNAYFAG